MYDESSKSGHSVKSYEVTRYDVFKNTFEFWTSSLFKIGWKNIKWIFGKSDTYQYLWDKEGYTFNLEIILIIYYLIENWFFIRKEHYSSEDLFLKFPLRYPNLLTLYLLFTYGVLFTLIFKLREILTPLIVMWMKRHPRILINFNKL